MSFFTKATKRQMAAVQALGARKLRAALAEWPADLVSAHAAYEKGAPALAMAVVTLASKKEAEFAERAKKLGKLVEVAVAAAKKSGRPLPEPRRPKRWELSWPTPRKR